MLNVKYNEDFALKLLCKLHLKNNGRKGEPKRLSNIRSVHVLLLRGVI